MMNLSGELSCGTNELLKMINNLPKERPQLHSDTDELSMS
jgi:hypothetical protein